jgi:SNF2 family DNA or RNA helicase
MYEAVRQDALRSVALEEGEVQPNRIKVLAGIMKLRRACCHGNLVLPEREFSSAKVAALMEILDELHESGHRALIFSQFVGFLEIMRAELDRLGRSYQYLDGSTSAQDRIRRVSAFQEGEGELFLISLKAGGSGLNLTGADYVIHMDPWWNPAVEDQASDRAHRIGQTRPVTVYRLITRDTIEEKIVALHERKRHLADSLLEGTGEASSISTEELIGLLQESQESASAA